MDGEAGKYNHESQQLDERVLGMTRVGGPDKPSWPPRATRPRQPKASEVTNLAKGLINTEDPFTDRPTNFSGEKLSFVQTLLVKIKELLFSCFGWFKPKEAREVKITELEEIKSVTELAKETTSLRSVPERKEIKTAKKTKDAPKTSEEQLIKLKERLSVNLTQAAEDLFGIYKGYSNKIDHMKNTLVRLKDLLGEKENTYQRKKEELSKIDEQLNRHLPTKEGFKKYGLRGEIAMLEGEINQEVGLAVDKEVTSGKLRLSETSKKELDELQKTFEKEIEKLRKEFEEKQRQVPHDQVDQIAKEHAEKVTALSSKYERDIRELSSSDEQEAASGKLQLPEPSKKELDALQKAFEKEIEKMQQEFVEKQRNAPRDQVDQLAREHTKNLNTLLSAHERDIRELSSRGEKEARKLKHPKFETLKNLKEQEEVLAGSYDRISKEVASIGEDIPGIKKEITDLEEKLKQTEKALSNRMDDPRFKEAFQRYVRAQVHNIVFYNYTSSSGGPHEYYKNYVKANQQEITQELRQIFNNKGIEVPAEVFEEALASLGQVTEFL